MFSDQTAEISLDAPSRCLDAVRADTTYSRFFAATCSLLDENKLHLLRHHAEIGELGVDGILKIPSGGVESMCTSSHDTGLIVTTHSKQTMLWRIADEIMSRSHELEYKPPDDDEGGGDGSTTNTTQVEEEEELELEQLLTLGSTERLSQVLWRDNTEVLTLEENGHVTRWNTETNATMAFQTIPQPPKSITKPQMACDAHNENCLAVTAGSHVKILDFRQDDDSLVVKETISSLGNSRSSLDFTCVDYNPNKPHVLATGSQDGLVKFWDLRHFKQNQPLLSVGRGAHSHWVSRVKYNPFHDQLVLSSGTDAVVNLWHMATISSAPPLHESDALVSSVEHMDSVYDVAWGAADAWIYASVGHDGKVMLNHVASNEKYKILL